MHLVSAWREVIPGEEVGSSAIAVGDASLELGPDPSVSATHPVHGDHDTAGGHTGAGVQDVGGHGVGVGPGHIAAWRHGGANLGQLVGVSAAHHLQWRKYFSPKELDVQGMTR